MGGIKYIKGKKPEENSDHAGVPFGTICGQREKAVITDDCTSLVVLVWFPTMTVYQLKTRGGKPPLNSVRF